jgi:hypothetical protein
VLTWFLDDLLAGGHRQWTSEQQTTLEAIASGCPYRDGRSVYYARNLLSNGDRSWVIWPDDPACGQVQAEGLLNGLSHLSQAGQWRLWPNPVSAGSLIIYETGQGADRYIIYNTLGQQVNQGSITPGKDIGIESLVNGIYWLGVLDAQGRMLEVLPFLKKG